jgi:UV excision repair protein RAD23
MGNEREAAIANMESMGFARADIDAAMRAAFFNPDRAVEYLLTVRHSAFFPKQYHANRI